MKKLIISLLFLLISFSIRAQVNTVNEGFETWPGAGWTNYALGAGQGWIQSWQSASTAAHSGSHSAYEACERRYSRREAGLLRAGRHAVSIADQRAADQTAPPEYW